MPHRNKTISKAIILNFYKTYCIFSKCYLHNKKLVSNGGLPYLITVNYVLTLKVYFSVIAKMTFRH